MIQMSCLFADDDDYEVVFVSSPWDSHHQDPVQISSQSPSSQSSSSASITISSSILSSTNFVSDSPLLSSAFPKETQIQKKRSQSISSPLPSLSSIAIFPSTLPSTPKKSSSIRSRWHMNKWLHISRSLINYLTIFLIFLIIRIFNYWTKIDRLVSLWKESFSDHCLYLSSLLANLERYWSIFSQVLHKLFLQCMIIILSILDTAVKTMFALIRLFLKKILISYTSMFTCLSILPKEDLNFVQDVFPFAYYNGNNLSNLRDQLKEDLNDYYPPNPSIASTVKKTINYKNLSDDNSFRPTWSQTENSTTICPNHWNEIYHINQIIRMICIISIASLVALIIFINIFYVWKSYKEQKIREDLQKAFQLKFRGHNHISSHQMCSWNSWNHASEIEQAASPSPASIDDFDDFVEKNKSEFLPRLINWICTRSTSRIEKRVQLKYFFLYICHRPSWTCIIIGFCGCLITLTEIILLRSIGTKLILIIGHSVSESFSNLLSLLQNHVSLNIQLLQDTFKLILEKIQNCISLSWVKSILSEFRNAVDMIKLENITVSLGPIASILNPMIDFATCFLGLDNFKNMEDRLNSSTNGFLKIISNLTNLSHTSLYELKDIVKSIPHLPINQWITHLYDKLIKSLMDEITFFIIILSYGSLIIWQGLFIVYVRKIYPRPSSYSNS